MRDYSLIAVGLLVLLAGVTGGHVSDGSVNIIDTVDRDCDGRLSSFAVDMSLSYSDSADVFSETDAYLRVEYADGSSWKEVLRVDDLPSGGAKGTVTVAGSDFPSAGGPYLIRIAVYDDDLTGSELLTAGRADTTVSVEPDGQDVESLEATLDWSTPTRRGQPITFSAADQSNSECTIVSYAWDFDGDGITDREGQRVNYTYNTDGRHNVSLTVENSRGTEKTVSETLVVMFDPDGDGVTNAFERKRGSDPRDPDTDDDLLGDALDPMPASFLVPTGLVHILLVAVLYLALVHVGRK